MLKLFLTFSLWEREMWFPVVFINIALGSQGRSVHAYHLGNAVPKIHL